VISVNPQTPVEAERALGIVWQDPPKKTSRGLLLPWRTYALVLRRKPGVWARLHTFDKKQSASSQATKARRGDIPDWPADDFELRGIVSDDGTGSVLYGRYIGSNGSAS
jgi:hypothetical protein